MLANIGLILYAIIGLLIFCYYTVEGWLAGEPIEFGLKVLTGAVIAWWWGPILGLIIIWAIIEIIWEYTRAD